MIYIIRHGQTEKNRANVLQGRSDIPLNDSGRQQAEEVRNRVIKAGIHFDLVYTSPLIRAVQTAAIIAEGIPQLKDDRLIEMDYGPYEGMDLADPAPEVLEFFRDFVHNPAPNGMEPLQAIVVRLGSFLEEIREEAAEKNILISTHAIAMKGALEYLTPDSGGSYWSKFIGNCAVYTSEITPEGAWVADRFALERDKLTIRIVKRWKGSVCFL